MMDNAHKQALVERLLYLALLLILVGVGIALYVAFSFGDKLDHQIKDAKNLAKAQAETIQQIRAQNEALKSVVGEIKDDNQRNTSYLQCLIDLHAAGTIPGHDDCKPVAVIVPAVASPVSQATPAPVTKQASLSSPQSQSQPNPRPSTTAQPAPKPSASPTPSPSPVGQPGLIGVILRLIGL